LKDDVTRFGKALDQLLHERGISQNALGARLGITGSAVNQWVTGRTRPSRDNVQRLEDELAVDPRGSLLTLAGYAVENDHGPTIESLIRSDPTLAAEDKRLLLRILATVRRNSEP
jgi:transcriptional regulator with XRE-family HTH domain